MDGRRGYAQSSALLKIQHKQHHARPGVSQCHNVPVSTYPPRHSRSIAILDDRRRAVVCRLAVVGYYTIYRASLNLNHGKAPSPSPSEGCRCFADYYSWPRSTRFTARPTRSTLAWHPSMDGGIVAFGGIWNRPFDRPITALCPPIRSLACCLLTPPSSLRASRRRPSMRICYAAPVRCDAVAAFHRPDRTPTDTHPPLTSLQALFLHTARQMAFSGGGGLPSFGTCVRVSHAGMVGW